MSQNGISSLSGNLHAGNTDRLAESNNIIGRVDVEDLRSDPDAEFRRFGITGDGVVTESGIIGCWRDEEGIDFIGDGGGEVIDGCAGIDDDLDLGGIVRVAEVGEPAS